MSNWVELISFSNPQEAHLAKAKLESEGIDVILKDELTTQLNFYSSIAIGGVKLLIEVSDYEKAYAIFVESGYIKQKSYKQNKYRDYFNHLTSKIPIIGRSSIEFRLTLVVAFVLIIITLSIYLLSLQNTH